MLPIILSILLVIALAYSVIMMLQKRKKTGVKGIKPFLSSICLYLISITNLLAYWLDFLGVLSWSITIVLLILGAYFTKYLHNNEV
ncbi:hypothetical protein LG296_02790 [Ureibacillus chungkukjangi]|uniref:hypothetical protein n=1 Tax=Ureibacillus chungkukjangi TaxID=1202712 RepID=UPI00384C76F4